MEAIAKTSAPHSYTREEYFAIERGSDFRHEYHAGGQVVAMAGGSESHARISLNFASELRARVNGRPCEAFNESMRVKIKRSGHYYYPDASAVCGGTQIEADADPMKSLVNPNVIVEVLSPSTERFDRRGKFDDYFSIDSLREYVLVEQDEARVTVIRRDPDGGRRLDTIVGLDQTVKLLSIDVEIPMSDIYRNVEFPPPPKHPGQTLADLERNALENRVEG